MHTTRNIILYLFRDDDLSDIPNLRNVDIERKFSELPASSI